MTCEWVRQLLPLYPEAAEQDQRLVQEHIERCPECRREMEEFNLMRSDLAVAHDFTPEVYAAMSSRVHARIRGSRQMPWLWAAAAGLLLAAGLSLRPAEVAELHLAVKAPAAPDAPLVVGFRKPAAQSNVRHGKPAPRELMEIRIVGDDPSVLIVWQIGDLPSGGGDE